MAQPRYPDSQHGCPGKGRHRPGAELRAAHLHPNPVSPHDGILPNPYREAGKAISLKHMKNTMLLSSLFTYQYSVIWLQEPTGLYTNFTLMPEYLQKLGYRTHAVGK